MNNIPYVIIIEQPSRKGTRFRYECEGKFAGVIAGDSSTSSNKTYPTIKIVNYKGPTYIVVSCVEKDPPHRPHPHNLVGKEKQISNGISYFRSDSQNMEVSFNNLGIQCVKRKDVEKSLTERQKLKVDPFNTGFSHVSQPNEIDLYCVRLCFQVFIQGQKNGTFNVPLKPVVSDIVYDRRLKVEPVISWVSRHSDSVSGGTEMCILCDKAVKGDIEVVFSRDENNWQTIAEFTSIGVYKQAAVVFKSPKYIVQDINEPVQVFIELRRISDGVTSKKHPFQFYPLNGNVTGTLKRKRASVLEMTKQIQDEAKKQVNIISSLIKLDNVDLPNEESTWNQSANVNNINDLGKSSVTAIERHNQLNTINHNVKTCNETIHRLQNNEAQNALSNQNELMNQVKSNPFQLSNSNIKQNSSNQNLQGQRSSDTLNSDSWIKELFESINPNPTNNIYQIAEEPETKYIPVGNSSQYNTEP